MIKGFQIEYHSEDVAKNAMNRIRECIDTGQVASGKNIEALEDTIAEIMGVDYVSAVSNGSDGLEIGLRYVKQIYDYIEKPNVIVPTNTFMATVEAARRQGFEVRLADIDEDTFGFDGRDVEKLIDDNTVCVIPVHIGGYIAPEMEEFCAHMAEKGIFVIEDAAHSFGAKPTLCGDMAVSSFFATKVVTGGEGGVIWTNNKDIHDFVRSQRNFGKPQPWVSFHPETGWNYRMHEFAACLIDEQIKDGGIDKILNRRREIAELYMNGLGMDNVVGAYSDQNRNTYYKVIYKTKRPAAEIKKELEDEIQFPGGVYDIPIHLQPAYKEEFGELDPQLKKAEHWCSHHLALPIYSSLSLQDVTIVIEKLKEADNVKS